jgi:hypothetical protein
MGERGETLVSDCVEVLDRSDGYRKRCNGLNRSVCRTLGKDRVVRVRCAR